MLNIEKANEADIREEIASPLLAALGYQRGTVNDILQEFSLSYDRIFLGRKKKGDPPLRGRADYILSVGGAARWTLEVKAPSEEINRDAIEQAISYARHPEISGSYAAVLNGKRFVVFHNSQNSFDVPLVDIPVENVSSLAAKLAPLLSPMSIRRDCSPPVVDLRLPLAEGLRSVVRVKGGQIRLLDFSWSSSAALPDAVRAQMDAACEKMRQLRTTVTGGKVIRDDTSRIIAKLDWSFPHDDMLKFAMDKNLLNREYVSLDTKISSDEASPTLFDVVGQVEVEKGEKLFNQFNWESQIAGLAMKMNYRGQALGYIAGSSFLGKFQTEYEANFQDFPIQLGMFGIGTFEIMLDTA